MSLLVFQLPGMISPRAGAANSPRAPRPSQPQSPSQSPGARAATNYFNHPLARLSSSTFDPIITATKSATLFNDADGDGLISPGDTLLYTVNISNSGSITSGVTLTDTLDANTTLVGGSLVASPIAVNDTYTTIGNVSISVPAAQGLLANDLDANTFPGAPNLTISSAPTVSAQGGNVSVNTSTGAFTYDPPAGFHGSSDSFTYTLDNGTGMTDTATVTININGLIWFIDNNAPSCTSIPSGCGRLSTPLSSLAAFNSANGGVGNSPTNNDNIFIFESATQYTGAVALLSGQKLIGQDATATLSSITGLVPQSYSAALPTMNSANGTITNLADTVTVNTNVTVRGLSINSTTATGMNDPGVAITGVSVSEVNVTTTTGTAVLLSDLGGTLSFIKVSANGGGNGISLTNTTGSFTVDGDGANIAVGGNGSGGTISNATGADGATTGIGVYLNNAQNVTLRRMTINGTNQNFGIRGFAVNGFALEYSTVSGTNGTNAALDEAAVAFDGLTGAASVNNSILQGSIEDTFRVINTSGTLNRLTVDTVTFGTQDATTGNDALTLLAQGTAVLNATVQNCNFTRAGGDHFQINLQNTAQSDLVFQNNIVSNPTANTAASGGGGITIGGGNAGSNVTLTYDINGNTFSNSRGDAILVAFQTVGAHGSFTGTIRHNIIGIAATDKSGSSEATGIEVRTSGSNGDQSLTIFQNTIRQYSNFGILLQVGANAAGPWGAFNVTVDSNTISNPSSLGFVKNGIQLNSGTSVGDAWQPCIDIKNNTTAGSGDNGATDMRLRQRQSTTVHLPGYGGAATDTTAVANYLVARNTSGTAIASTQAPGGGFVGGAACGTPAAAFASPFGDSKARALIASEDHRGLSGSALNKTGQATRPTLSAFPEPMSYLGASTDWNTAKTSAAGQGINKNLSLSKAGVINPNTLLSGETINKSLGVLPSGKSITVKFRATINNPLPSGVCQVSNQGSVSGSNFSTVLTNTVVTQLATPPEITGATISRQQGTAASTSQIATVSDCNQAANTLAVTVNGGASATVNGVTVSGISIDGAGNVTASVVASCTATNASFTLTVTDNTNKTATANLTVNVTANTPPTLGTYPNATVTPGGSTTVTPSAAPTDNGTVASLTASAPGFTGTFSGNTSTGVITITNAGPAGVYTVTVTATDNCGATTTTTFTLTVNTPPTITGATISRQQGTAASTSQIATVSDADQPANTLTVTVNGGASATVNGVTVSGISIDGAGNVTASAVASCSATNATFTLTVTDNQAATANATLTVNVTANTPPTLGTYPTTTVTTGGSTTVTPSAAPTDNGTVASLTASAPGFTGTFSGDTSTGVITITNAGPTGVYTVTVTATDNCGATTTTTFQLTVNSPPTITGATISRQQGTAASTSQIATVSDADQPANTLTVTVNGGASATVNDVTVSGISVDGAGNVTASVVASCSASNASFTLTVTDNVGATANATLTVNVTANTPPSLGTYPNTTVNPGGSTTVTPSAAPSDNGSVVSLTASAPGFTGTFSGNTSTGVITITNANPPGNYTVTVTATDNCGATTVRTFTLNVNTPPTITGATITRQQGAAASVSQIATVSDPDQPANTLTVTVTPATGTGVTVSGVSVNASGQVTASVAASCGATNSTFTVTVTDNQGASANATLIVNVTPNTAPAVTITGPASGSLYATGTTVNFTGTFTDNTVGTHTAQWTFTSNSNTFTQAGTVNETTGAVTASFTFTTSGVYQVTLAVTDACGATGTANTVNGLLALVVIFDPNGAFVTGGGFINSPAGAYVANPSLTGQANFGLNAKYKNNDTVPTGDTEFHFNAASFNFKSTSYDYLVVDGARAQYQGSGKVNNGGSYGFIVTIIDGKVAGGGGVDKFRIKIWDKNNNNAVVYDSQLGDPDTANPTTSLGGGSVVIHN